MRDPEFKRLPGWVWVTPLALVFISIFGAITEHIDRAPRPPTQKELQDEEDKKVPVIFDGMTLRLTQDWMKLRSVHGKSPKSYINLLPSDTILYTSGNGLEYEIRQGNVWYRNGSAVPEGTDGTKFFYVRAKPPAEAVTVTIRIVD